MKSTGQLDKIHISRISTRCLVGIRDWERVKKQEVEISVTLHVDLQAACDSDSIDDTVDYKKIKDGIIDKVEGTQYNLVEKMASDVAEIALGDGRVERVDVLVDKLTALRFTESVAVEISRGR